MAPKNKFTKEEMTETALRVVREHGLDGLTAKTLAAALGTSTQPVFTAFGSMDGVRQAVHAAATRVYDQYTQAGLQEDVPFLGVGRQYLRFAREEPELYRLLFLTRAQGFRAALAGAGSPDAHAHLPYHCCGGRPLFPGSLARGTQPRHADRDRRLHLL